jgi:hypothetical protein
VLTGCCAREVATEVNAAFLFRVITRRPYIVRYHSLSTTTTAAATTAETKVSGLNRLLQQWSHVFPDVDTIVLESHMLLDILQQQQQQQQQEFKKFYATRKFRAAAKAIIAVRRMSR